MRRIQAGDEGRGVKASVVWQSGWGLVHLTVGVGCYHLFNTVQLTWINDRPNIDTFVQRIANAQFVHSRAQFGEKAFGNGGVHEQA